MNIPLVTFDVSAIDEIWRAINNEATTAISIFK